MPRTVSGPLTCRMSRSRCSRSSPSSSTVRWTAGENTASARGARHPGAPVADHSPCLLPMSTSTSWKLSAPSACGGWGRASGLHQHHLPGSARGPTPWPAAAYAPGDRAAGGPPAPRSSRCSAGSPGWTRRPQPPCRGQSQELGPHTPPPSDPQADSGPGGVSLEPGRVDLQHLLGAGQSSDDPRLRSSLSGPGAPATVLLQSPTTPGPARSARGASRSRRGQRLQLEVARVFGDVVGPQCRLLRGGGGSRAVEPYWPSPPQPWGSLLPAPPHSWPGGWW